MFVLEGVERFGEHKKDDRFGFVFVPKGDDNVWLNHGAAGCAILNVLQNVKSFPPNCAIFTSFCES